MAKKGVPGPFPFNTKIVKLQLEEDMILLCRFSSMLTLFIHHVCPNLPPFSYPQTQALQILEALALHARSYHNDKQHKLYAVQFPVLSLLMLAKPIPQVTGLLLACHNNHSSNFSHALVNRVLLVNHTEKNPTPRYDPGPKLTLKTM
jgi:hypothetical protein